MYKLYILQGSVDIFILHDITTDKFSNWFNLNCDVRKLISGGLVCNSTDKSLFYNSFSYMTKHKLVEFVCSMTELTDLQEALDSLKVLGELQS